MVEKEDVDDASDNKVEDKDGDASVSEKKAPRQRWNNRKKNKSGDRYTQDDGEKEKFDGTCDDMKNKYSVSAETRQTTSHTHTRCYKWWLE